MGIFSPLDDYEPAQLIEMALDADEEGSKALRKAGGNNFDMNDPYGRRHRLTFGFEQFVKNFKGLNVFDGYVEIPGKYLDLDTPEIQKNILAVAKRKQAEGRNLAFNGKPARRVRPPQLDPFEQDEPAHIEARPAPAPPEPGPAMPAGWGPPIPARAWAGVRPAGVYIDEAEPAQRMGEALNRIEARIQQQQREVHKRANMARQIHEAEAIRAAGPNMGFEQYLAIRKRGAEIYQDVMAGRPAMLEPERNVPPADGEDFI